MNTAIKAFTITASFVAVSCSAYRQAGVRDAKADFASGIMQIETAGGMPLPYDPYEEYLEKNGIKMNTVAGCMIDKETADHLLGYNSTMMPLIKQRLGKDIFKEAEEFAKGHAAKP